MKMRRIGMLLAPFFFVAGMGCFTVGAAEETDSMMCDGGLVEIGDLAADVESKCGAPDSKQWKSWRYDFGPSEVFVIEFDQNGSVIRILGEH
jgi:hypothetical protein